MDIGYRIKERRKSLDMTQVELAKLIGTEPQTIHKYEHNIVTNIPIERLLKLAEALRTSTSYLLGDTDDPDDKSFRATAVDLAWQETIDRKDDINNKIKAAEEKHLQLVREICTGDSNYRAVTPLYNIDWMPIRINMVTEFLDAHKDFLRDNMPGIAKINE